MIRCNIVVAGTFGPRLLNLRPYSGVGVVNVGDRLVLAGIASMGSTTALAVCRSQSEAKGAVELIVAAIQNRSGEDGIADIVALTLPITEDMVSAQHSVRPVPPHPEPSVPPPLPPARFPSGSVSKVIVRHDPGESPARAISALAGKRVVKVEWGAGGLVAIVAE